MSYSLSDLLGDLLGASAAIALALPVGIGIAQMAYGPPPTPEQQAGQSSVKLSVEKGHGSGVIVGKNLILTNQHVAALFGKEGFKVTLPNGLNVIGHVIAAGVGIDLALVDADTGSFPAAKVECSMPAIGQGIYSFGNPIFLDRAVTWGRVSGEPITAAEDTEELTGLVPMDLTINPGNSGGGVWTTRGGSPVLVGVSTAAIMAPLGPYTRSLSGLSLMIPAPTLCHFLGRR